MSGLGLEKVCTEITDFRISIAALARLANLELGVCGEKALMVGGAFGCFFATGWVECWSVRVSEKSLERCLAAPRGLPVSCSHGQSLGVIKCKAEIC